jgi:hypothetical protein
VTGNFGTVGGGKGNSAGFQSTVAGGLSNTGIGDFSTVSGGAHNIAQASNSTVGGGYGNTASGSYSTIGGGSNNSASDSGTVSGGNSNSANAPYSTVSGGLANHARGPSSTVAGGSDNFADGKFSFAAGVVARANHDNAFVWGGDPNNTTTSQVAGEFVVNAPGGTHFVGGTSLNFDTTNGRQMLNLWGPWYGIGIQANTMYFRTDGVFSWYRGGAHNDTQGNAGGGSMLMSLDGSGNLTTAGAMNPYSDRNAKEGFGTVDVREVLAKVTQLPLATWNYKADGNKTRHIGPMAQDFHAAFDLGTDDKHIATVDADGVALAAIQGLNAKLEDAIREKDAQLQAQAARLNDLEQQVARMTRLLSRLEGSNLKTAWRQ